MKLIRTWDGSITFFNDSYMEAYHSVSGAMEEAFKKYATGPESNINLYECLREELIRKITSLRETCKIVDELLQELEVDNVESLDNYALLLLSLLLRENECLKM